MPYLDAKFAAALCVGRPVKYELRADDRLSDTWVLENIGATYASIFPNAVAIVLGKALLWAI